MSLDIYIYNPVSNDEDNELFWSNITNNLKTMAERSGCGILWDGTANGMKAKDILPYIDKSLAKLGQNKNFFLQFNAKNGWGTLPQFVMWLRELAEACAEHPEGIIYTHR